MKLQYRVRGSDSQETAVMVLPGMFAEAEEQIADRFDNILEPFGRRVYVNYAGSGFNGPEAAAAARSILFEEIRAPKRVVVIGVSFSALVAGLMMPLLKKDGFSKRGLLVIDPTGGIDSLSSTPNQLLGRHVAPRLKLVSRTAGQLDFIRSAGKRPDTMKSALRGEHVRGIRCPDTKNQPNGTLNPFKALLWWDKVAPQTEWQELPGLHCDFANKPKEFGKAIQTAMQALTRELGAVSLWTVEGVFAPSTHPSTGIAGFLLL